MSKALFLGADKHIFERAAALRKEQTFAEEILWNFLRTKPFGLKFRRQHPFSTYILDFYCHRLRLAIEVDGSIHELEEVKLNDGIRQRQLEQAGLTFLRFTNEQITQQLEEVIDQIRSFLKGQLESGKDSST